MSSYSKMKRNSLACSDSSSPSPADSDMESRNTFPGAVSLKERRFLHDSPSATPKFVRRAFSGRKTSQSASAGELFRRSLSSGYNRISHDFDEVEDVTKKKNKKMMKKKGAAVLRTCKRLFSIHRRPKYTAV
eukprot:TRINITY_DN14751_c0_g1_i1.p1 TRINITY_DN14751_c0_g1~~TRINITY_DN14751_c0_g1_i1.p1  ORF type:complete len:132 (+),score=9.45 TRINITY_DN14751_c0_g1_i1:214-609(+)